MIFRRAKNTNQVDEISGQGFDEKVFLRLFPYLRPHLGPFLVAIAAVFVSAGAALYAPRLLGQIVDEALLPRDMPLLYKFAAVYGALELLRVLCIFFQSYRLQAIGQDVMHSIRNDLFARLQRMPVSFFDRHPTGKLVTRVTNDSVNLSELFSGGFVLLLSDVLLIVGVIGAMLAIHWRLGLLTISVFPVMALTMYYFSGRLRLAFRRSRDVLARLNAFFAERVAGMPVIQLMEREGFEREAYRQLSSEYCKRQFEGVYLYSLFHPAITVLSAASIVIVIWFGPKYLSLGDFALGTFVSFLAYAQVLYQPVRNITDRYNIFLAAMSSAERIFTLMDMAEEPELRDESAHSARGEIGALRFESVSFTYPSRDGREAAPALREVSFELRAGETAAIVGHTGAGKTTLTSLLFRFYEPGEGRILLSGRDLRETPKLHLRSRLGFVQQDVFLFSGTLRENLVLLRRGISDEEILNACARTGFARVLERLPHGLDTELDERGTNLSLGERQILAFSRVYLQQPDVLVLDEATSSVDRESEILLQRATKELMKGRTSLVIAHRLETVREADKILVLDHGRLIEEGSHAQLMERGGTYARFVNLQERGHERGVEG